MILDGGGPSRPRLPVDFTGPTCAKCVHAHVPGRGQNWKCRAGEPELVSEGSTDPVTGVVTEPVHETVDCVRRNRNGDCELFEAKREPPGPPARFCEEHGLNEDGTPTSEPALVAMSDPDLRPDLDVTAEDVEAEAKAWRDLQTNLYGRRWRPFDWLRRLFRWLFP